MKNTLNKNGIDNNSKNKKKLNVKSLDGLRAFAILGVIFYHLDIDAFKGGLIGVTIFFVLSGYLITGILLDELRTTNSVNLKRFWLHRIRRLFPAIFIVVIFTGILCMIFNHALFTKMRPDVVPCLCWLQNWWYIIRSMSYFDAIGDPSPLIHFWSLAIEEQFYIVWPLIIIGIHKLGLKNKISRRIIFIMAIVSFIAMFILYNPSCDPTRVYYGTDTRAFSLLIGAWLAYIWPIKEINSGKFTTKMFSMSYFVVIGVISLFGLIIVMVFVDGLSPLMYYGLFFLSSILAAVLIGVLVIPNNVLSIVFSAWPLVWIGKRSYGMYLWHFPILLLLKPLCDYKPDTWWFVILVLVLTIIISAVQYKYIENPIRRKALKGFFGRLKNKIRNIKKVEIVFISAFSVCVLVFIMGCIFIEDESFVPEDSIVSTGEDLEHAKYIEGKFYPILIGDSVTGNLKIPECFPHGLNDSVVSRWTYQGVNVLQEYQSRGSVGNVVVFACFSNHPLAAGELESIKASIDPDCELFLVNSYCPTDFSRDNNQLISEFQKTNDKVHVIDWNSAVSANPDAYLYRDHIHLQLSGQILYTQLIAQEINSYLPENSRCDISKISDVYNKLN